MKCSIIIFFWENCVLWFCAEAKHKHLIISDLVYVLNSEEMLDEGVKS